MLNASPVGPETASRTARAVSGDSVIAADIGAERVRGAHRDGRRFVAGAMNLSVNFLTRTVFAVVTGGGNNHDARVDQPANRATYRIIFEGVDCRRAQTHVNYANVVSRAVSHEPV